MLGLGYGDSDSEYEEESPQEPTKPSPNTQSSPKSKESTVWNLHTSSNSASPKASSISGLDPGNDLPVPSPVPSDSNSPTPPALSKSNTISGLDGYASSDDDGPSSGDLLSIPAISTSPERPKELESPKKRRKPIEFPPSPNLSPIPSVQKDVKRWVEKISSGETLPFNQHVDEQRKFLNPYLLSQASKECNIDEYATNFNKPNYNRSLIHELSTKLSYEVLRDRQNKQVMAQKSKERKRKQRQEDRDRKRPRRDDDTFTGTRQLGRFDRSFTYPGSGSDSKSVSAHFLQQLIQQGKL